MRARTIGGLLAAMAAFAPVAPLADEAATSAKARRIGDWTVECRKSKDGGKRRCVLGQTVAHRDGDQARRIISAVVGDFGPESRLAVLFTLPLGVYLPSGVIVGVDGAKETKKVGYQFCSRTGCRAGLLVDDALLGRLKTGQKLIVTVRDNRQRPVRIPVSLKGLAKGIEEIGAQPPRLATTPKR